jgi:hypothetical protein
MAKDQIQGSHFNATGTKFACGGDDGVLYMMSVLPPSLVHPDILKDRDARASGMDEKNTVIPPYLPCKPKMIANLFHPKKLDDVYFASGSDRILSSCKDGCAYLWTFSTEVNDWQNLKSESNSAIYSSHVSEKRYSHFFIPF